MTTPIAVPDLSAYGIESHWRDRTAARRRLLVVYAHPDDESFGNGGAIARYSAAGVAVHYACATRGECGTVPEAMRAAQPDIGALRSVEMACAAEALGLRAVHYLGYRDSGMPGSADNAHPAALVGAPLEHVIGQVVALIRALRPQVVLTFGPYGGYGHPDHIFIHEATLPAFEQAADPLFYPAQIAAGLTPWQPRKLYYSTFAPRLLRVVLRLLRLAGRDPRRFGENNDVDLVRVVEEVTPVTTTVDCRAHLATVRRAWACHASQLGSMGPVDRLPDPLLRLWTGTEQFTRVVPPPGRRRERDLFAGFHE